MILLWWRELTLIIEVFWSKVKLGRKKKKKKKKSLIIVIITVFGEKKTQHFYIGINYTAIKMYTLYFRELI